MQLWIMIICLMVVGGLMAAASAFVWSCVGHKFPIIWPLPTTHHHLHLDQLTRIAMQLAYVCVYVCVCVRSSYLMPRCTPPTRVQHWRGLLSCVGRQCCIVPQKGPVTTGRPDAALLPVHSIPGAQYGLTTQK